MTKLQIQAGIGLDLLQLLQTVTEDGQLTPQEATVLRVWLDQHADTDLPAITYLRGVLQRVLADGRLTPEREKLLYEAVERVLPPEYRQEAMMHRRELKAEAKKRADEERARLTEEERKKHPTATFDFMVAGAAYENRSATIARLVSEDTRVYLVREPSNQYSPNAVLVILGNGLDVGYVPEIDARHLAPLLDAGAKQVATVKKILHGHAGPIPVVWGALFAADAKVDDAIGPAKIPQRRVALPQPVAASAPMPQTRHTPENRAGQARPQAPKATRVSPIVWVALGMLALTLLAVLLFMATR